ncbi:hypothetical protein, partial [Methylomagnum sp.]
HDDWIGLDDMDVRYAFEQFAGKSNDDMQEAFKKNVIERCDNLRFMPMKPFKYYIFGLKKYVESNISSDSTDAASCFLELIQERFIANREEAIEIIMELMPTIEMVALNQHNFGADTDIYGNFLEKLNDLKANLSKT